MAIGWQQIPQTFLEQQKKLAKEETERQMAVLKQLASGGKIQVLGTEHTHQLHWSVRKE